MHVQWEVLCTTAHTGPEYVLLSMDEAGLYRHLGAAQRQFVGFRVLRIRQLA